MRHKICIIENDKRTLNVIADFISLSDHLICPDTCRFTDAASALESIPRAKPDAVIVDLELGSRGRTGVDCIRELREKLPAVPLVVYSKHDEPEWIFQAIRAGAHGYILKARPEELLESLKQVCLEKICPPIGSQIAQKILQHFPSQTSIVLNTLTVEEEQVLVRLSQGKKNRAIAEELKRSARRIDDIIASCKQKLAAKSREEAVLKYSAATRPVK